MGDLGTELDPAANAGETVEQRISVPWLRLAGWWLASILAALIHNRLWATPNVAFLSAISSNLGSNPFSGALRGDYLISDLSLTSLARVLGQTEPYEFARLHLAVVVLGWLAIVALAMATKGYRTARALTVVLAASPLITVSMQWLGQPDPLTGFCGVAMVLVKRRWQVVALAVIAGLTHPEQALFMAATAGALRTVIPTDPDTSTEPDAPGGLLAAAQNVALGVGGVVAGWAIAQIYLALSNITLATTRSDYLGFGFSGFWDHHTQQPLALLWTLWGLLWLLIPAILLLERQSQDDDSQWRKRMWLVAGSLAILALVPAFITLDETRVYAVITAPILAALAIGFGYWRCLVPRSVVQGLVALLIMTAVVPGGFATGITSWRDQLPPLTEFVTWLGNGELPAEADGDETAWLLGPFTFEIPDVPD